MQQLIRSILFFSVLFLTFVLLSCSGKDKNDDPLPDNSGPSFEALEIFPANRAANLVFSEPVYQGGSIRQPLTAESFSIVLQGGTAVLDSVKVTPATGDSVVIIVLHIHGLVSGEETLTIRPAGAAAIVNARAVPMDSTAVIAATLQDPGITGSWVSTGENLSALFGQFGFDSVKIVYGHDGKYTYTSITTGGMKNVLTGTYVQEKIPGNAIRKIRMDQQSPVAATIEGIFQLENGVPVRMIYETAQTEPAVAGLTPPTPEAGFGSTGLTGSDNTQVYVRVLPE